MLGGRRRQRRHARDHAQPRRRRARRYPRPQYDDVAAEVAAFLRDRVERRVAAGHPGGADHHRPRPRPQQEHAALAGADPAARARSPTSATRRSPRSRTRTSSARRSTPRGDRLEGSLAAAVVCIVNGARIVRMHDVAASVAAARMTEAILGLREPALREAQHMNAGIDRLLAATRRRAVSDDDIAACTARAPASPGCASTSSRASTAPPPTRASPAGSPTPRTSASSSSCAASATWCSSARAPSRGRLRRDAGRRASASVAAAHGMTAHPVFAIVSRALDLDPAARIFRMRRCGR